VTDFDANDELYRATLVRMMASHGARLYGCASVLAAGVRCCPTAPALRFLGGHLRELTAQFLDLSDLHQALAGEGLAPPSLVRPDDPSPPDAWAPATAALLVTTRQARWQLHEHDVCAHEGYRSFLARVVAALDARMSLIEQLAEGAARGEAEPAFAASLDRHTAWAVEAFGRPGTPGMAYAIRAGLRRRDASATRDDFLDDLRAVCRARGLPLAARWLPAPERASFVHSLQQLAGDEPADSTIPSRH
jgi:hypothetical protein